MPQTPVRAASTPTPGWSSVVVLPLDNFSKNPEQEYFADGMTEAIIADLAPMEGLRVPVGVRSRITSLVR